MLKFNNYKTISITTARKLFNAGHKVGIVPCNVNEYHFFGGWHLAMWLDKSRHEGEYGNDFDSIVNNYKWYNCQHAETGRRPRFFVAK